MKDFLKAINQSNSYEIYECKVAFSYPYQVQSILCTLGIFLILRRLLQLVNILLQGISQSNLTLDHPHLTNHDLQIQVVIHLYLTFHLFFYQLILFIINSLHQNYIIITFQMNSISTFQLKIVTAIINFIINIIYSSFHNSPPPP